MTTDPETAARGGRPPEPTYDVFISAKSEDYAFAREAYQYMSERGLRVFFSDEVLPQLGNSKFSDEIFKALEGSRHVLVVTSTRKHVEGGWVQEEWGSFLEEKRSGRRDGNLVTLLCEGISVGDLPFQLRKYEAGTRKDLPRLMAYLGGPQTRPPAPPSAVVSSSNAQGSLQVARLHLVELLRRRTARLGTALPHAPASGRSSVSSNASIASPPPAPSPSEAPAWLREQDVETYVRNLGYASTTVLQRKYMIDFTQATALIDRLRRNNVITTTTTVRNGMSVWSVAPAPAATKEVPRAVPTPAAPPPNASPLRTSLDVALERARSAPLPPRGETPTANPAAQPTAAAQHIDREATKQVSNEQAGVPGDPLGELRRSASLKMQRGHWETAIMDLEKLAGRGEPLVEYGPKLVTCLLSAHEIPLAEDRRRAEDILTRLERAGHHAIASPLRHQLMTQANKHKGATWLGFLRRTS